MDASGFTFASAFTAWTLPDSHCRSSGSLPAACGVVFAEVGVPVKADASFSVSRALQLQLPKQLAILEEVSEHASREYSLERALDKMQVGHACNASMISCCSCCFQTCVVAALCFAAGVVLITCAIFGKHFHFCHQAINSRGAS